MTLGLVLAFGSLFKHVVIVPAACLALAHILIPHKGLSRAMAVRQVLLALGVVLGVWGGLFGYFAVKGDVAAFYDSMVGHNRAYAGDLAGNVLALLRPNVFLPPRLRFLLILGVPMLLAAVASFRKEPRRVWGLLLFWMLGTPIAIALPGKFWWHYYQLWLPVLCMGGAMAVWAAAGRFRSHAWIGPLLGAVMLACLVAWEAPYYRLSAEEWSMQKYKGDFFIRNKQLARRIDALLMPGETFYYFGDEPDVYFHSRRRPPTGVVYVTPYALSEVASIADRWTGRILKDLAEARPEMVVTHKVDIADVPTTNPIGLWIKKNYWAFEDSQRFVLLCRKGGALQARLARQ